MEKNWKDPKKMVTVTEAARLLRIHKTVMWRYVKQKRVKAWKIHKMLWLIELDSLMEFKAKPRNVGHPRGVLNGAT